MILFYDAIFKASALALRETMADSTFCEVTNIGFTSVLHTVGGDLVYHPHIHVLIPGRGLNQAGEWKSTRPGFLVPVLKLSKTLRIRLEQLIGDAATEAGVSKSVFKREFVSFAKPVGDGVATLKYLSRYMFRTAITNKRIVAVNETHVSFTYRKKQKRSDDESSSKEPVKTMTLPATAFLSRFLQHVLPRGHQRVRHYGFLSRTSKTDLNELRAVILQSMRNSEPDLELIDGTVPVLQSSTDAGPKCPTCGEPLTFESFIRIRPPPLEWRGHNFD